ncbi:sensor histidine kinase [Jannaschia sp. S6380]|uniref:sensor histidine kinase n=1 Tax=Jannaschia sp. S6380 TaxID=2926408 RepID=UPI001FF26033|nr:sensor histidine kinase [Jannaschia sp. S6380]MCK0167195.1 sensor histidine kinase [Jannaschia sp. S6380]
MTCSSYGQVVDFSDSPELAAAIDNPVSSIRANPNGPLSGTSILAVAEPVFGGTGDLLGFVNVSIPHESLRAERLTEGEDQVDDALVELVTFNARGEPITALGSLDAIPDLLPEGVSLASMAYPDAQALTAAAPGGAPRIYTVAPITRGQFYVLGIWDGTATLARQTDGDILTSLFPALMWAVSLAVSLFAVHQLITRHLTRLGRQMALFTAARRIPRLTSDGNPPSEIKRIQRAFHDMTEALIRDEASLENAVREKSVLVKEIHHRVKNNLQLISSIINLQIRDVEGSEAKHALRQTQDRVLGMATIHRDLYQTDDTGLVNVGHLIEEVVRKSIDSALGGDTIALDLRIERVWLFPDQAVPMSLLTAEAVMNAIKHMPPIGTEHAREMSVRFHEDDDRTCHFCLSNTMLPRVEEERRSTGMGRKLMRAFATQLDAEIESREADGWHHLTVTFRASDFTPAPGTY